MSGTTQTWLRGAALVLTTALLVIQVIGGDWIWAALWGLAVVLVASDLARQAREGDEDPRSR